MKNKVKGFTLVELLIVIALFSIIMFGAMQLMIPSRAMFQRSYQNEDVAAAEKNIKNLLEENLRFAEYIQIDDGAMYPYTLQQSQRASVVANSLKEFINKRYNGMLKSEGTPGEGRVYVMYVDNESGGIITTCDFKFTAGNLKPDGTGDDCEISTTDASIREYASNKASYDRYQYIISLGSATTKKDAGSGMVCLEKDQAYYDGFTDGDLSAFGPKNCTFTISAYDTYPNKCEIKTIDGKQYFTALTQMTASMALPNMLDGKHVYLHHNFVEDVSTSTWNIEKDAEDNAKWCGTLTDGCNLGVASTGQFYVDNTTIPEEDYVAPKHFRIIYTYPQF